jgi:hypothetical protein
VHIARVDGARAVATHDFVAGYGAARMVTLRTIRALNRQIVVARRLVVVVSVARLDYLPGYFRVADRLRTYFIVLLPLVVVLCICLVRHRRSLFGAVVVFEGLRYEKTLGLG